jgi:hypothetical protein
VEQDMRSGARRSTRQDVLGCAGLIDVGIREDLRAPFFARLAAMRARHGQPVGFSRAAIMRWVDSWSLQVAKERQ